MPGDRVTLALQGEVTLGAFAEAVVHFSRLVDALSRDVGADAQIRWVITELEAGSAIATARGIGDRGAVESVTGAYIDVGKSLERGVLPDYSKPVQEEARELVSVIERGVEAIRFETVEADATIRSLALGLDVPGLQELSRPQPAAYGGVQGRVQMLTNRGGLRFTLYDTLYDKPVSCHLGEGQDDIMRDVWGRVAVVEGLVSRDAVTGRAQTIRRIRRVAPVREARPDGYRTTRGLFDRPSDPRSPEARLRELRDA